MLMVNGQPLTSSLGNFYFSPVRLRPVFETAYFEKPRLKRTESNLDLSLEVKPKFQRKSGNSKIHSTEDVDDDENESDDEKDVPKKKGKKKIHHRDRKHKSKKHEDSSADAALQHLCSKLRVSFVLGALGVIIFLACCCALFLRNRIAACCKRCWPCNKRKKKNASSSKTNLFDVEEGGYPYQMPFKKSKKKKNLPRLIDTGTQDSRTTMAAAQDEPPVPTGCSPCSKKKKRKTSKKR